MSRRIRLSHSAGVVAPSGPRRSKSFLAWISHDAQSIRWYKYTSGASAVCEKEMNLFTFLGVRSVRPQVFRTPLAKQINKKWNEDLDKTY